MSKEMQCPICKGSGHIAPPSRNGYGTKAKREAAKLLKQNGYSVREIQ